MGSAFLPAIGRRPFRDPALPWDQRVDDLLQRLALEERIALPHQHAPPAERPGAASFRTWSEALHGVARRGGATVFPQTVGLGAIWDGGLVHEVATAVPQEMRAFHRHRRPTIGSDTNSLGRDRPW